MLRYIPLFLLFCISNTNAAELRTHTETYIDVSTNQKIRVKFKRNSIQVKYLTGNSWSKYILIGPAVFSDRRGSTIYLKRDNRLVWRSRRHGQQVTFRKLHRREGSHYNPEFIEPRASIENVQLEGVWFEPRVGKELILVDSRSGIKLKFRGEREWTFFEKKSGGVYVDRNGNSYRVIDYRKILWNNANGTRSFVLEKRSDSIDWD